MASEFTGKELRKWRVSQKLSQSQLAEIVNDATGKHYGGNVISAMETGKRGIPDDMYEHLFGGRERAGNQEPDGNGGPTAETPSQGPPAPGEDAPPRQPAGAPGLRTSTQYAKACSDLWDFIGFSTMALGAGLRSPAVQVDGKIIRDNKTELGAAYGELAEQNATFRRFVLALSEDSTWAKIVIVTGKVAMQMAQNHTYYAMQRVQTQNEARAQESRQQEQAQEVPIVDVSDGNVPPAV